MISNRNWASPKQIQHDGIVDRAKSAMCAIALAAELAKDEAPKQRIRVGGRA